MSYTDTRQGRLSPSLTLAPWALLFAPRIAAVTRVQAGSTRVCQEEEEEEGTEVLTRTRRHSHWLKWEEAGEGKMELRLVQGQCPHQKLSQTVDRKHRGKSRRQRLNLRMRKLQVSTSSSSPQGHTRLPSHLCCAPGSLVTWLP